MITPRAQHQSADSVSSGKMRIEQEIGRLLGDFSIEVTPKGVAGIDDFRDYLPVDTRVYITYLPNDGPDDTVAAAHKVASCGAIPVPHIPARALASRSDLQQLLERLTSSARVSEVLIVGGDRSPPAGEFDSAVSLLRTGLLEEHGIRKIGVTGYPTGHPEIDDATLTKALADKNAYAAESPARFHIVTQFAFAADPIVSWHDRMMASGNQLPVHVGLPGATTIKTLVKFARICGVKGAMRAFSKYARDIFKLAVVATPAKTIAGLAKFTAETPDHAIEKLHFFPFGSFKRTTGWARAALAGEIVMHEAGDDFDTVDPALQ